LFDIRYSLFPDAQALAATRQARIALVELQEKPHGKREDHIEPVDRAGGRAA
jgi:hypothetical protein